MVTVLNLRTGEEAVYSCASHEAVVAAYAQRKGDWSTWAYMERYGAFLQEGDKTWSCGDWAALKHPLPVRIAPNGLDWCQRLNCLHYSRQIRGKAFGAGQYIDDAGEPVDVVGWLYAKHCRHFIGYPNYVEEWFLDRTGLDPRLAAIETDGATQDERGNVLAEIMRVRAMRGLLCPPTSDS